MITSTQGRSTRRCGRGCCEQNGKHGQKVEFVHVKGHAGNKRNEVADELDAIDEALAGELKFAPDKISMPRCGSNERYLVRQD